VLETVGAVAAITGVILIPLIVALLQFRSSKDTGSAALTNASMAFVNEIQEEREGWKKLAEKTADEVLLLRTDLSGTQAEVREYKKRHVNCQTELAELRHQLERKADKENGHEK
jgi:uncharacterized protein YlxW (UPF0749 family)